MDNVNTRITYLNRSAARYIGKQLVGGRYAISPLKEVKIPKADGGFRVLSVPVLADRIVEKGAEMVLSPSLEPRFMPQSIGFRPGLDRFKALAALVVRYPRARGKYVLSADIQKAFDHIRHRDVEEAIRHFVPDPRFRKHLMRQVARPNGLRIVNVKSGIGIGQGSPLSPVILNMVLHRAMDVPFTEKLPARLAYVRYADDLMVAFLDSREEANHIKHVLDGLLKPLGLSLHAGEPKTVIVDLRNEPLKRYLGLQLRQDHTGDLAIELTPRWREDVRITFEDAVRKVASYHGENEKYTHFAHCGESWIKAQGPAYREATAPAVAKEVADIAQGVSCYGRAVIPKNLLLRWKNGRDQWLRLLNDPDLPDLSRRPAAINRGASFSAGTAKG